MHILTGQILPVHPSVGVELTMENGTGVVLLHGSMGEWMLGIPFMGLHGSTLHELSCSSVPKDGFGTGGSDAMGMQWIAAIGCYFIEAAIAPKE